MIHWNIYDIENIFSVVKVMGLKLPLIKYIQLQRVGVVLNWDITLQRKKNQTPSLKNKHMEKVWRYQKGYWESVNRIMTHIIQ